MANYSWIHRTLQAWADHWRRAARRYEIQTAPQLWDKIMEGRAPKSTKQYMKVPSKKSITEAKVINYPFMPEWVHRVHVAVTDLPRPYQRVIFERYFGDIWERYYPEDQASELGITKACFKSRLRSAHKTIEARLEPLQKESISVKS